MTALGIAARRFRSDIAARRFGILTIALILLTLLGAVGLTLLPAREPANAASVTIPLARASQLIQATTGAAANDMQAVGDKAKLINAALPFVGGPILSARPFAGAGNDIDQRRALLCLTQAVYYEAGFEPVEGRRAVAQVVLNRMRHPAFPKSVCGVVYQNNGRICQFTFACDGSLQRAPAAAAWRRAEEIARAALAGYVERSVGSATHYHADYVAPRWAPLLAKVSKLGQHIFYRWPGAWGQPAAFTGRYIGEPRDPLSLRPALPSELVDGQDSPLAAEIAGPPVPRAANDVGGLLDVSKGWTLSISGPEEGAASKLIAAQEGKTAVVATAPALAQAGPAAGSR